MPNYRNAHDTAHQMDGAHWRNELCLLVPRSISLAQTAGSTLTIPSQYPQHVPRQTRSAVVSVGATSLAVRQVLHPAKKSKTAINAFDMLSDNASIKLMLTSSKGSKDSKGRGSKDKNEIRSPKHFTPKSSPQNHLIFVIIFRLFVGFPADLTRRQFGHGGNFGWSSRSSWNFGLDVEEVQKFRLSLLRTKKSERLRRRS